VQLITRASEASDRGDRGHQPQVADFEIHGMRLLHHHVDDQETCSCMFMAQAVFSSAGRKKAGPRAGSEGPP
jgi:hypothetical protein